MAIHIFVLRFILLSASIPLVHLFADYVVVSSGKTSSHVGEKDKFTCTVPAGGKPPPTLKIYFKRSGGTPVEVTQGQDRVMAKEDNQAEYYCEAKVTGYPALDMTSSRKTYNVTFQNTKVSFLNPTITVQVGQVKKFTCETDESNPVTYIEWYQSFFWSSWRDITTGVTSSERNGVYGGKIRISEWTVTVTNAMNGASVRCRTAYWTSQNSYTRMYFNYSATELNMVKKPSAPISAGVGVIIKCETDSTNPVFPGTISWYRNGQQITSGVTPSTSQARDGGAIYISQLTFTARKEDNQAKYECKINDQASFRKDVTITVNSEIPPIVNLKVTETGQTTATVTWDRVTSVPVTNYELNIVGTGPLIFPNTVKATEVTPYVTVKGITPGRQYVLSVRAVIGKNKGPKASEKLFIVPLLPGDIDLREQKEVTYEVTSSGGVIGQYEHYEDIPDILRPYNTN